MARSAAARKLLAALDAELAGASEQRGQNLVWTAAESAVLDDIGATVDRMVVLRRDWSRADDPKLRVKLSAELRLLETSKARLLKSVTPDLPTKESVRTVRARRAVNFERECMLTLVGIFMVVVVALLSNKEQRKGAWLLAAVVIVLVLIVDWMR